MCNLNNPRSAQFYGYINKRKIEKEALPWAVVEKFVERYSEEGTE